MERTRLSSVSSRSISRLTVQLTEDNHAPVVIGGLVLDITDLVGEAEALAVNHQSCRPALDVSAISTRAPSAQQKRLAAYLDSLAQAAGHSDRIVPFKAYCTGLLLPGERKGVEPMAAKLEPDNVRRMHQSLHHLWRSARHFHSPLLSRCSPVLEGDKQLSDSQLRCYETSGIMHWRPGSVPKMEEAFLVILDATTGGSFSASALGKNDPFLLT